MVGSTQQSSGARGGAPRIWCRGWAVAASLALILPSLVVLLAVGAGPAAAQGNPVQKVPATGVLEGIACPSATTCVSVGSDEVPQPGTILGTSSMVVTTTEGVPAVPIAAPDPTTQLYGIACVSAAECVAVGDHFDSTTLSYEGAAVPITNGVPGATQAFADIFQLHAVSCVGATLCISVGTNSSTGGGAVVAIDPTTGQALGPTVELAGALYAVSCPSATVCEAVGRILDPLGVIPNTGAAVEITPGTTPIVGAVQQFRGTFLFGVSCFSAQSCEAVGYTVPSESGAAVVLTPGGTPGTVDTNVAVFQLSGVSCPSATTCEAVGATVSQTGLEGVAVTIRGGAPGPVQALPGAAELLTVACASDLTCEAAGYALNPDNTSVGVVSGLAAVGVGGSQTYGSSTPTFTTTNPPPGTAFSGALSCTTVNAGAATISATLPAGTYTLDAAGCSGLSIDTGSVATYAPLLIDGTFTVNQVPTTTTLVTDPNPSAPGQQVTLTATVSGSDGGGAVAFSDNGVPMPGCQSVVLTAGQAVCTSTAVNAGDILKATYSGDTDYQSSVATVTQKAQVPVAVTVTGSQPFGGSPTFTATPTAALPSGVNLSGTATCTTVNGGTPIAPNLATDGTYLLDGAHCSGVSLTGPNAAGYVVSLTGGAFTVNQAPTSTTVAVSPAKPTLGGLVTFTATVAPAQANHSGVNPTGTVVFSFNGAMASVTLGAGGTASFNATLPGGTTTAQATYEGDANFLGSTSTAAATATTACATTITGTRTGVIVVGPGLTCLAGARFNGTIVVGPGGSLDVENSTVSGAIAAIGADSIRMCGDTVHGAVAVVGSTGFVLIGDPGEDNCAANVIGGALAVVGNTGGLVVVDNTVATLSALANRGSGPFPDQTGPIVTGNHP